MQEFILHPKY